MKNLLLTLGHNSSAILIENGKLVWGYETERITGIKSDSQFPQPVIDYTGVKPDIVYVTHWSPTGNLFDMSRKHWKPEVFDGIPIRSLSSDITHHDTHMAAAACYAGKEYLQKSRLIGLVIDGFGSMGEHLSIYSFEMGKQKLLRRYRGYDTSLGLFFQYATAFMGLKMHEDEYKLLGYEAHVGLHDQLKLDEMAEAYAEVLVHNMGASIYGSKYDPVFVLDALVNVKARIYGHLSDVCAQMGISDSRLYESRCILSYYVQAVLERTVWKVVKPYKPGNLLLSGGVFYNVKLNRMLLSMAIDQVCVYPLAGDQGNAIGLYYMDHPEFEFPTDLNWGVRKLCDVGEVKGLHVCDETAALELVISTIRDKGLVNLVRGNMEFGPRAMCNTSTLALPTKAMVDRINKANMRNTVMPMAPVMTESRAYDMFYDPEGVHKSLSHMVVAMEYIYNPGETYGGVAHEYNLGRTFYTGRPQICKADDAFMQAVLQEFGGVLINTSFNYHGKPIAFDMESIIANHKLQYSNDPCFTTVVIQNA